MMPYAGGVLGVPSFCAGCWSHPNLTHCTSHCCDLGSKTGSFRYTALLLVHGLVRECPSENMPRVTMKLLGILHPHHAGSGAAHISSA